LANRKKRGERNKIGNDNKRRESEDPNKDIIRKFNKQTKTMKIKKKFKREN
jgi:hypothetical protein